jgi:hypothetical protein
MLEKKTGTISSSAHLGLKKVSCYRAVCDVGNAYEPAQPGRFNLL